MGNTDEPNPSQMCMCDCGSFPPLILLVEAGWNSVDAGPLAVHSSFPAKVSPEALHLT